MKKPEPQTAPSHAEHYQIMVVLPERKDSEKYAGDISYSDSTPVALPCILTRYFSITLLLCL